ncbi:hypothetical protein EVAR_54913_1 [Eumeta japonica]|uniref:Uncharacterized protein n=1 Tax=Eumeta variegata TaxID=151549 RepID=A0A4C1YX79_EUMVA|nr:hypothetical protein EVAR_54913_1 [Eumeta japonica]
MAPSAMKNDVGPKTSRTAATLPTRSFVVMNSVIIIGHSRHKYTRKKWNLSRHSIVTLAIANVFQAGRLANVFAAHSLRVRAQSALKRNTE